MLQNKTEGIRCGRPLTGRVRDGDGETGLFGSAAFHEAWRGRERREAQSWRSPGSGFQKFFLTHCRSQCAATGWTEECECGVQRSDCFLRIFSRLMFIVALIHGMASVEKPFCRKFAPKVYNYSSFRSLLMSETAPDRSMWTGVPVYYLNLCFTIKQ